MREQTIVVGRAERKTIADAGQSYVRHLATVRQRKRTTIEDYRGSLPNHLAPHFGERTLARIEPEHVENYVHGLFAFAVRRRWAQSNPVAMVDRPPASRQHTRRIRFPANGRGRGAAACRSRG